MSWIRLRQIALVAHDLDAVVEELHEALGIEVAYRDPAVATFGLRNAVLPVGDQFIEVVSPTREGTAGGRQLERLGGDGGYMVICHTDDHPAVRDRVRELGVRTVLDVEEDGYRIMQLHPGDTGGSFLEIDQVTLPGGDAPDGPWPPAGKDWKAHRRTARVSAIVAAELQSPDPQTLAERWARIAELALERDAAGRACIALENATLRFVPASDGRGEGLGGIDLRCADRAAVLAAADERGARVGDDRVDLVGMRIRLV
jgi:Glyoxalase-like domain